MPPVTIGLPASVTAPAPARDVSLAATTVGEALHELAILEPQYSERIFYRDRLLVAVTLNGRQLPAGRIRETALSAGDRLDILSPVAGG